MFKNKVNENKAKVVAAGLLLALVVPSKMLAATGDVPAVVGVFADVVSNIITKVVVGLVVLIMLMVAAWEMKENGNARPLKWAIFASVVMAGAVFFGPQMVNFMTTQMTGLASDGVLTGS